ncbi:MAG: hypothetical protein AAF138_03060 [Planctomycetota bacterium]
MRSVGLMVGPHGAGWRSEAWQMVLSKAWRRFSKRVPTSGRGPDSCGAQPAGGSTGFAFGLSRRGGRAQSLIERAGACDIEALEERRYLFSLTIDSVPAGSTVGTASAVFGYTIPILFSPEDVGATELETTIETFNDIDPPGPIASPTIFAESNLRLRLDDFPFGGTPAQVIGTPDPDDEEQFLRLGFQDDSRALWDLTTGDNDDGGPITTIPMTGFAFDVLSGFDTSNIVVRFFRTFGVDFDGDGEEDRQELASFTGAALAAENDGTGTFIFDVTDAADFGLEPGSLLSFDQVEIESLTNQTVDFDNVQYQVVTGSAFADNVESRVFGVEVQFTGPLGASVNFQDLYGREIIQTLGLGRPEGSEVTLVDPDDNGVPNFNDGIGRITITGANEFSSLRMFGGTIEALGDGDDLDPLTQTPGGGFVLTLADSFTGLYDEFEEAGFGFFADFDDNDVELFGLPPGPGSVIIGSPIDRPQGDYRPGGLPQSQEDDVFNTLIDDPRAFNDSGADASNNFTEGIFFLGGSSFGVLNIHGMLFGSSLFEGAVEGFGIGTLYGSVAIDGDLGEFVVGGEAGVFIVEPEADLGNLIDSRTFRTSSQITIGRTAREILIAGESRADVTVSARINEQDIAPPRDVLEYTERENVVSADIDSDNPEGQLIRDFLSAGRGDLDFLQGLGNVFTGSFGQVDALYTFGNSTFRNDSILSAEFIGSVATSVFVTGELGRFNGVEAEDTADVFAFAVDENRPVVIQTTAAAYVRVVDQDGRTLAAVQGGERNEIASLNFTFEAPSSGVYYLVVTGNADPVADGDEFDALFYSVTLTGMAPVALGAYRTGGASGSNTVTALGGSVGSFRVGTAYVDRSGAEVSPTEVSNAGIAENQLMTFRSGAYTAPAGSVFDVTSGSDIQNGIDGLAIGTLTVSAGLDIGRLTVGLSAIADTPGPRHGDVIGDFVLDAGRHIGVVDIRGGIGVDGNNSDESMITRVGINFTVLTGTRTGQGDLAVLRTGAQIRGASLGIQLPRDSTLGALLVQQDLPLGQGGGALDGIDGAPRIVTGIGSDVRFVDTPQIDSEASADTSLPILAGTPLVIIDDGGAQVTINVPGTLSPVGAQLGTVRLVPIDGSLGVAIASIDIDLSGGERLDVTTTGADADVVSIGRVTVTNSANGAAIRFDGQTEIDVWLIDQADGEGLVQIENFTAGGDLVAVDVQEIETLTILGGNLGRTQVPDFGPDTIGPQLGVAAALQNTVGGPLGFSAGIITADFNGGIFRPINAAIGATSFLDDAGGLFDGALNGLVVRNSFVQTVSVAGAVGDVILQGANTALINLFANSDGVTAPGEFDGIVGNIFAPLINSIDVGDGLLPTADSPLPAVSIFAEDDIFQIVGGQTSPGAFLSGAIGAANAAAGVVTFTTQAGLTSTVGGVGGVGTLQLVGGGDFVDLHIRAGTLDRWWSAFRGTTGTDTGLVNQILGTNADFLRSEVEARQLNIMQLNGGRFDASALRINDDVGDILVDEVRNSTLGGSSDRILANVVVVGGDLGSLRTNGDAGDLSDLIVTVEGSLLQQISGRILTRLDLNIDNTVQFVNATEEIRGSVIRAGRIESVNSGQNIRSSEFRSAGPIVSLTAGGEMLNVRVSSEGPDGRIDTVSAGTRFIGDLISAGAIGTVRALNGNIVADIETTTDRGSIQRIESSGDLVITVNAGGAVSELVAGGNIGRAGFPDVVLSRGAIGLVDLPNGQLFADIRAGGAIGTVNVGGASNLPGFSLIGDGSIEAFGRIEAVTIDGDFAGTIRSFTGGVGSVTINDGSLLPEAHIEAVDGSVGGVTINAGHLLGSVSADLNIFNITVNPSADGVFGDIGVNPLLSPGVRADAFRNQLPVGVSATSGVDGASITAGQNIGVINVTGGSVFESFIAAGRAIGTITVSNNIQNDAFTTQRGSVIAAADSIAAINVGGNLVSTFVLAGTSDFGQDERPGGVGVNADSVKPGVVNSISVGGGSANVLVSAGLNPGADGVYSTGDDRAALGISAVQSFTVAGGVGATSVFADSFGAQVVNDGRFALGGFNLGVDDPLVYVGQFAPGQLVPNGAAGLAFSFGGETGVITHTGGGQVFFNAEQGQILLVNTDQTSTVNVTSATGTLTGIDVVSNNNAGVGSLTVAASLLGDSSLVIDGVAGTVSVGAVNTAGRLAFGGNVTSLTTGPVSAGVVSGNVVNSLLVSGAYGAIDADVFDEVGIDILTAGSITIAGATRGRINIEREANAINLGFVETALIRAGGGINVLNASSLSETRVSVGNFLNTVNIAGDMFDSALLIGADLGADATFGGINANADVLSNGSAGAINIGGDFVESDIVAGFTRGPDGFFGTADDSIAPGRSFIGSITIAGDEVGSGFNSESFRIASTGGVGPVTVGGVGATDRGNFAIELPLLDPEPIQVTDLVVSESSRVYTASIFFNQPVDISTIPIALAVSEVRGVGEVEIRLIEGLDFTTSYNEDDNELRITFARDITERDLPQLPGVPGPGIFRFTLDADALLGASRGSMLDGDGDGFATPDDDFSADNIVGDAGDKTAAQQTSVADISGQLRTVDFRAPINLDIVLDNNVLPDQLPDPNTTFTLRGSIGDHPDHASTAFRFAGDQDVYSLTLQEGQILRLSELTGAASDSVLTLITPSGEQFGEELLELPNQSNSFLTRFIGDLIDPVVQDILTNNYLVKETGQYLLVVGETPSLIDDLTTVPDVDPFPRRVGDYAFDITIFDDGDSGFAAPTDAGNGAPIVNAPLPSAFAGPDGQFGTADDQPVFRTGAYSFTRTNGPDGVPGTGDDVVTGNNGQGIFSSRVGSTLATSVNSAIGTERAAGVSTDVFPDVDVFHLNNRAPIAPGTNMTITVQLDSLGADLGSTVSGGAVQFGLFDTTNATGLDDAELIFAPTDFSPNGGEPGVIASGVNGTYGYDANGDFFITFRVPGDIESGGAQPAQYAIMLQGVLNTDYAIQIVTTPATTGLVPSGQNFLIETSGGVIDWLLADGRSVELQSFDAAVLGFTGQLPNGQDVEQFVLDSVTNNLNSIFADAGLDVTFARSSAQFEFQDFSTIFLTDSTDPVSQIFGAFGSSAFGFSERSDPFNIDRNDEAVVFAPSLGILGLDPTTGDVDEFILALTAAIGRRAGELLGLRLTAPHTADDVDENDQPIFDLFSADSVFRRPGPMQSYIIPTDSRPLSELTDSITLEDFFIGRQASASTLSLWII